MSWKVLVTASGFKGAGRRAQQSLRQAGCQIVLPARYGPLKAGEIIPLLPEADAVLASLDDYSASVLSSPAAAQLKTIARWGVGYDTIEELSV